MLWFENQNITIFLSQKSDDDMLFKNTLADSDKINEEVRANRISFFKKHDVDPARLVNLAAVHGANIAIARDSDMGKGALDPDTRIPDTDALITNVKKSYLMITGADCFPVFFYDERNKVIAVAHCGWRGIIKEIIRETVLKLRNSFDSSPADIKVWIGPGIKTHHYPIQKDLVELFSKNYKNNIIEKDNQTFLDLVGIITLQLIRAGIKTENITTHPDCTFCEKDKHFSYRRDKPEIIEANAFIIHLK